MLLDVLAAFAAKLIAAVLKQASLATGLVAVARSFDVLAVFGSIHAMCQAKDIPHAVAAVGYEVLTDQAASHLVERVVEDRFQVSQRPSGLYVAESKIVRPEGIWLPSIAELERKDFRFNFSWEYQDRESFKFDFRY